MGLVAAGQAGCGTNDMDLSALDSGAKTDPRAPWTVEW